jgi:hypothetical protein
LEYFPQKQRQKQLGYHANLEAYTYFAHLATLKSSNSRVDNLHKDTAETETEVAEKSSWDQENRGQKLGLV